MSRGKCLFFSVLFCFAAMVVPVPGVGATSTGTGGAMSGGRPRRDAATNTSNCPSGRREAQFFLDEIIQQFGQDGHMDQKQLQSFLRYVDAECYSAPELLEIYSVTEAQLVNDTSDVLTRVCPAVLYQTMPNHSPVPPTDSPQREPPTTAQVWGYGILFVTIINMSALMGACIVPCMDKDVYKLILTYLVGLAVGTLSGNAILSLIPETHNMYVSTHGLNFVWRNTTIIAGVYMFFVVERILKLISMRNQKKSKRKALARAADVVNVTAMHDMSEHHAIYKITSVDGAMANGAIAADDGATPEKEEGRNFTEAAKAIALVPLVIALMPLQIVLDSSKSQNGHSHTHMPVGQDGKVEVAAVAYMIIFGDGLHNFVDGLAIGASFALSVFQGISTSVAVICEEFPHELGDFAILLKSGMTVKKALMFNFMSALTCYAGLVVGILVGQLTSLEPYIFALAGGMFLYISLVDMLPELNHMNEEEEFNLVRSLKVFVIQNAGLLSGYTIMILLAVYGEHIAF